VDKKAVFFWVKSAYKLHDDVLQRESRPNFDPQPEQLIWKRLENELPSKGSTLSMDILP
jgi:hypothetical protein